MARYIDAEYLEECMRIVQKANKDSVEFNKRCRATDVFLDIWGMIKEQPTADVIEVVRCKDCKHADKYNHCDKVSWWNNEDDFCSRGER